MTLMHRYYAVDITCNLGADVDMRKIVKAICALIPITADPQVAIRSGVAPAIFAGTAQTPEQAVAVWQNNPTVHVTYTPLPEGMDR